MLIDWFTVGAQLLNFLILVWLMKRFLYQPVLDAIAAREQKIAAELAAADTAKAGAQKQQEAFRQKNEEFDQQRADMLREAQDAAKAERERLLAQARDACDAERVLGAKALLRDAQHLRVELTRRTQEQVYQIASQVLGELASASLEQQACAVFIKRLRAIDGPALAAFGAALAAASDAEPVLLRSAFELPAAQRAAIQTALDETFAQPIPLQFETTPALVSGIELSTQGQKLAWSISDYLAALASDLQERLAVTDRA